MEFNEDEIKHIFEGAQKHFDETIVKEVLTQLPARRERQLSSSLLAGFLLCSAALLFNYESFAMDLYQGAEWSFEACQESMTQTKALFQNWPTPQ